jgi:hypothetical protein
MHRYDRIEGGGETRADERRRNRKGAKACQNRRDAEME